MKTTIKTAAALLVAIAFIATAVPLSDSGSSDAAADTAFTFTDDNGKTFTFDGPVDHLVVFGYGACVTVAETGNLSKIIGADKYSQYDYYKDARLQNMKAYDLGSPYANDFSEVVKWLVQQVENGSFDKTKDAVIMTSSTNLNTYLLPALEEKGFANIIYWKSTSENYSDLVACVGSISQLAAGAVNEVKTDVDRTYAEVKAKVNSETGDEVPFIYVRSGTEGVRIGTSAGLGSSMLTEAGGRNIAADAPDNYGGFWKGGTDGLVQYLDKNPGTVIFIDANFKMTGEEFCTQYLGGTTAFTTYVLSSNWNNYCPDSVEALQTLSEFFSTYAGNDSPNGGDKDNTAMYAVIAVVVIVLAIAAAAFFLHTRKGKQV